MMSTRLFRTALTLAGLIGYGIASPRQADAGITVNLSIDGNSVGSFSGGNSATQNFATLSSGGTTFTDITINATSNPPGSSVQGNLNQVSISSFESTGSGVLKVEVVQSTPFTNPGSAGSQAILTSNVSRADGEASTLTFQSWVTQQGGGEATTGLQTFDPNVGIHVAPNEVAITFTRDTTYLLRNTLTLQAGDNDINVNGSTAVTAVPEPSTLAIAIAGLPVLAFGIRRRIRRHSS